MLLIGIDVGGTNTDGVLLAPTRFDHEDKGVIKFHKSVTTSNVSSGIESVIDALFKDTKDYSKDDVLAITIGTTHFINAVIEQDKARLEPVAVLRLCGPYGRGTPPFCNFPSGLTEIIQCYDAFVDGGFHIDSQEIQSLDEEAIIKHAEKIKELGINSVAITGIFSAINSSQEYRAAELIRLVLPKANIVMSHEVSGLGFLSRENATILNASIMTFASKIVHSFINSAKKMNFKCPVLLTQNDGTVLTVNEALKTPIRTFSSGATNSMRGASFLCSNDPEVVGKSIMVADIGGTTTDVGLLLPSGFPRQSASHSVVGGVRMNFSMPHVESIGLGGGSIVRKEGEDITIGPDSVGSSIVTKSLIFGGDTITTTDVNLAVNGDKDNKFSEAKSLSTINNRFDQAFLSGYHSVLKSMLETTIDQMRTSPEPIPVLLVGGGSFIAPLELDGASKVIRPKYYQVANAIGAALGKLSFVLQKIEKVDTPSQKDTIIEEMKNTAIEALVRKGALELSIKVIDLVHNPIPYVDKAYSFEIKLIGDVDYERISQAFQNFDTDTNEITESVSMDKESAFKEKKVIKEVPEIDHKTYKPFINSKKEWIISETDLEYISIGTYILGCGGGGTPYPHYLELRNLLRNGATPMVIDWKDAEKSAQFIPVASAGSPTVTDERLHGNDLMDACEAAFDYYKKRADGIIPVEIGGSNGLSGLVCGSKLNLPTVDCDLMGRAYPTMQQIKPCIYHDKLFLTLSACSDGNGNQFLITNAKSDIYVEKLIRAALSEVGAEIGVAHNFMNVEQIEKYSVHNSISNSWRIGRAVITTRQEHDFDKIPERILEALGGQHSGKKIFQGKVVEIEKKLFKGHVYGEVTIENQNKDRLSIPFKNENLVANLKLNGKETITTIASVPDLISVCYADSGEAVGTPEYRYGIMVFVLVFAPDESWRTPNGLKVGGPESFGPGFDHIQYKPIGQPVSPKSVIEEFYRAE